MSASQQVQRDVILEIGIGRHDMMQSHKLVLPDTRVSRRAGAHPPKQQDSWLRDASSAANSTNPTNISASKGISGCGML